MGATLEITTNLPCVNNCAFCPQDKLRQSYKGKRFLTLGEFCVVLDKLPKTVRIDFSAFSEPFVNPEASLMMREADNRGFKMALFTTFVGMTERDIDNIRGIVFSPCVVHAPDNTNFKTDEDVWVRNYKLFAHSYAGDIDDIYYHIGEIATKVKMTAPKAQKVSVMTRANNVNDKVIPHMPKKKGRISCPMGTDLNQNVMLPNGDVVLCCMDWGLKHPMGNLLKDSYANLFKGKGHSKAKDGMADDNSESICRYCYR